MPQPLPLLFRKTFAGHSGRPGQVGGSVKRASVGEGSEGGGASAADQFIPNQQGDINLGAITPEFAATIKRQAGPIRLQHGWHDNDGHGRGLIHINAGHLKQIQGAGYADAKAFVEEVAAHYTEARRASGGALLLAKRDENIGMTLIVRLMPSATGDFYTVETALPMRSSRLEKGYQLLGVRSEPATTTRGGRPAFAQAPVDDAVPALPNAISSQTVDSYKIEESGKLRKAITLMFPNGHAHTLTQQQYRWQVSSLCSRRWGKASGG